MGKSFGSPHVLKTLAIPTFDAGDRVHTRISELSERCHGAAQAGDSARVNKLESELDEAVAAIWGIPSDELEAVREALQRIA